MVGSGGVRGEPPDGRGAETACPLRQAAAILSRAEGGLAAYAAALLNWHRRHRFCSRLRHAESDVVEGGLTRLCPNCGAEHHPRTDPVVIMLVTDGDRLMLGRQASWPSGRYSALAGFVEPGEALEEAVAREVREEAGVRRRAAALRRLAALALPRLADARLLARRTRAARPQIRDDELQDVRWFERAEIEAAAAPPTTGRLGHARRPRRPAAAPAQPGDRAPPDRRLANGLTLQTPLAWLRLSARCPWRGGSSWLGSESSTSGRSSCGSCGSSGCATTTMTTATISAAARTTGASPRSRAAPAA